MLSAVETFGTATAAAHNPFAIAAAAVVMPTQNHLQQSGHQVSLEHYTIGHSTLLSTHNHHHHHQNNNNNNSHQHHRNHFNHQILSNQSTSGGATGGLFPVYSSSSTSSSSPSSTSCSPPINKSKSPSDLNNTSEIIAMSSTEFVRPHPKQPRYSTANNNNNNNNNNSNFCNNNNNNNNKINNNNIGSNGIPLQIRNNKITSGNNCSAGTITKSSIGRQRKYSAEPQSGPVNLVTNNNNNNNSNNNNNNNNNSIKNNNNINNSNNNGCRLSSPNELIEINGNNNIAVGCGNNGIPLLQQKQQHSPQSTGGSSSSSSSLNDNDVLSALYSQKLPFATAPTVVSNAIAAAYQFNYPHIYARTPYGTPALYPSHHSINSRIQQFHNYNIGSTHPNDLTFSPYLPSSIQQYTNNNNNNNNTIVTGSLNILQKPTPLSPTNLITSGVVNNNNNNNNSVNNSNSRNVQQQYTIAQQQTTNPLPHIINVEQPRSMLQQLNHHSDNELKTTKNISSSYSTNNSNNNNIKIPVSISSSAGFKVPSGKDGSLKHRFLTRPTTENEQRKQKSQITTTILRTSNITNAPSNFTKGSFIELSNGVLRKVEDMRTEDFIQSAERSQYHQLADSTVVKIGINTNTVIITFCYDKNRLKADVEVSLEHPFFVYGQGWASCNPELSLQAFGLKCQRLQVGDVCISLISREETTTTPIYNSQQQQPTYYKDNNNIDPLPPSFYPQNLSRKSHQSPTILTSSTGVAVSSRLSVPPPPPPTATPSTLQVAAVYLPLSHVPSYGLHSYETKTTLGLQNSVIGSGGNSGIGSELISIYPKHAHHGHDIRKSHTISEIVNSTETTTKSSSNYQLTNKTNNEDIQGQDLTTTNNNISKKNNSSNNNDEPIDVSLSRKRKCDDNEDFK